MKTLKGCVAFWPYDKFPFILGGHITEMNERGAVETREYGPGFFFKPIKILPAKAGEAALAKLEELRAKHDRARADFDREWRAKLAEELPILRGKK